MRETRKYLQHINLSDAVWGKESAALGVPNHLLEKILLAVEAICGRNGLGMHGRENEVAEIEAAIDLALKPIGNYLKLALENDEDSELEYNQGRLFAVVRWGMFSGPSNLEDEASIEALLLYQLDRLVGAYKEQDVDKCVHLGADICDLQTLLAEIRLEREILAMADFEKSKVARNRAKLRHSGTEKERLAALAEWEAHGSNVSSMAAFARSRHKDFGVTERTLYGWVRDHRKANT